MARDDDKTQTHVALTNGTMVSHYRIISKIGAGGMGEVYLAEDTELNRKVALKFLPPHLCQDADCRARFKREAQAAARLSHPNIVTIHEVSEFNGRPFFAMEHIEGESLADFIKKRDHSIKEIIDLSIQICEGLNQAHQAGIIHRDIKPSNILVDQDGRAKILDFGLAAIKGSDKLTKAGLAMGTLHYMSPEQTRGEEVDQRSDIFSFGAVLYEMITGQLPFKDEHEPAIIYSIGYEEPEPLARYKSGVPDELQRIVFKALAKPKDERYQHVDDLRADLKRCPVTDTQRQQSQEKSIVVLPFENLSPDPYQEYFSDGLTEEVISDLSTIGALRVISRSSAMTFKGTQKRIPDIARELNVQYVLEGSVRKAGNSLRITAQLIDATADAHVWADKYSGTLDDIFDIQEKVSRAILGALKLTLGSHEEQRMSAHAINNAAAYECYLKAQYEIDRFDKNALDSAIRLLQNGIDIVGDNALLCAGMAHAYHQLVNIGVGQEEYIIKGEEWAQKALALDPDLPQAHLALATQCTWKTYPQNLQGGIRHSERALAINPHQPQALRTLAGYYALAGRLSEARIYLERAVMVDPLNSWNRLYAGYICFHEGRYDLALTEWHIAYQIDAENSVVRFYYAWALALDGQKDRAFAIIDRSAKATPDNVLTKCGLMLKYGLQKDGTRALLEMTPDFQRTCRRDYDWSFNVAAMLALVGATSESLDWLENAVSRGFINYVSLQRIPYLDSIRGEERFKKLMERVKYEWEHFEL